MDTIRSLCIGVSAHQKLDHLQSLVKLLGYESIAVFGDCFDEARPVAVPHHTQQHVGALLTMTLHVLCMLTCKPH